MSSLFNVSTDYLLKEESEDNIILDDIVENVENNKQIRKVSLDEANDYMDLTKVVSKRIAIAVSILILSPVCLIQLAGLAECTSFISENMAGGIGTAVLLMIIAIGVAIIVLNGMRLSKYDYLEKEIFTLQYGVAETVESKKNDYEDKFRTSITIGVVLCILGVVPLLISAAFTASDLIYVTCVNLLLALVACGVYFFVHSGMINGSFNKLLQSGDYTKEKKETSNRLSVFSSAYWCIITAIYLGISFYTNSWDTTWIIWPVAGVLFAALYVILGAVVKSRES